MQPITIFGARELILSRRCVVRRYSKPAIEALYSGRRTRGHRLNVIFLIYVLPEIHTKLKSQSIFSNLGSESVGGN